MTAEFKIRNEIRSLTAFRFLAAFYVFLFHIQNRAPIFNGVLGDFISEGAVGMTMFFVLSGFILSYAYDSLGIDIKQYFWNRFARIYPIYLLAALLALPWLARNFANNSFASSTICAVLATFILLVFGLFLIQAWLPQTFEFWNNSASWSISNEAFFYLLFPFARDLLISASSRQLIALFLALSLLSSMVPVSSIVFSNSPRSFALFYALPFFRSAEFLCGIIAFVLMKRIEWSATIRNSLLIVLILGFVYVALLGRWLPGYTLHNWILIPAVSSALVLLYKSEMNGGKLLCGSVFVWLGQISYCFYSFQFHVLEGLRWLLPIETIGGTAYALVATILLLVVSASAHHFVEEPARVWIRERTSKAKSLAEPQIDPLS
ncbi:MAG TPA: acyltransferase [Methylocystis sp.]|jgi:peptidoglycan/LPS O-acetylase OafA/YrhL